MKTLPIYLITCLLIISCSSKKDKDNTKQTNAISNISSYKGTASVTQGIATRIERDMFKCNRGRPTDLGIIQSTDGKEWTVPAKNNFKNNEFPFAPDLHNSCDGNTYSSAEEALSKIKDSEIIKVDEDGELFTAYIFADNYFEMYVNGVPVGKDKVPFTQFNSSIVQFRAKKPFNIAMKLIDWEEHLGIGCEPNRGKTYHAGDGGMVAVIKDQNNATVATTNTTWKAQTFYTAPITNLSCTEEVGNYRHSKNCSNEGSEDGTSTYALHWDVPTNWMQTNFDDSNWPNATTYTNETIGVDNKPSYTNFTNIFDDTTEDAQFIWSTNVVLDNLVLVRYTVK